jgi:hypothetical protein
VQRSGTVPAAQVASFTYASDSATGVRLVVVALAVGAVVTNQATSGDGRSIEHSVRPRVTARCPVGALPLRKGDLPALRRLGRALAPNGVHKVGSRSIDYRDAHARARFPTFYTAYVRSVCPKRLVKRVIAVSSTFLVARPPRGFVGWAQMH